MLSLLHIENIAVIEGADIQFDQGFNALTGETGAGKSIVIDAIGAVIGQRTSRDLIRTGAKSALATALFTQVEPLSWFADNGIGPDENNELTLQREIMADGKNICRVGGRPVSVTQLRSLGCQLVNIHGQHDGQQLLDERSHLSYLDRFGETEPLWQVYHGHYATVVKLRQEIENLEMDESEKSRRIDTLTYQIGELERGELVPGEDEKLTARRHLLRNAGKLMGAVEEAYLALWGDDDREGALSLLMTADGAIAAAAQLDDSLEEETSKATELRYAVGDLAETVADLRNRFDFSPDELDQLESRLDVLYRLKKKYGSTVEEMLDYLARCRNELDSIQFSADKVAHLEKELQRALAVAQKSAQTLSQARKKAAQALEKRIQTELSQLDMPNVQFIVEFSAKIGEIKLDTTGMDEVQFLMSANVGEEPKPIQKIASGGELARIMLALKNVLAETDDIATMIFDEVDTGVSGRAAQKVAEKMAQVARNKQVLCVTHLPQIAAMADSHFSVEKGARNQRTFTEVERLSPLRRREELARISGGTTVTETMLESAGELLTAADEYKKTFKSGVEK